MEMKDRLKLKRIECGFTLEELARKIGTSKQTIHRYESGVITNIPSDKVEALAKALKTTPAYLMGWDDMPYDPLKDANYAKFLESYGMKPPIYEAAAGEGRVTDWYATEESSFVVPEDSTVVTVKGRSMEPTLLDGDTVIVVAQNVLDYPRQIALVKINGDEATLKRVEVKDSGIMLIGDNVDVYPPHFFTAQEVEDLPVRIEGVVVQLIRNLR